MSRFCPCCTPEWLYTVSVMNKVDGKPTIYWSGLASFTMSHESTNLWSFGASILPLLDVYCYFWCDSIWCIVKYYDSENKIVVLWEKFQSCFWFDQIYIWIVSCWFDQKNMWFIKKLCVRWVVNWKILQSKIILFELTVLDSRY